MSKSSRVFSKDCKAKVVEETEKVQKTIADSELVTMFTKAQLLEDDERKCKKLFLKALPFQKNMIKQLVKIKKTTLLVVDFCYLFTYHPKGFGR
jgi:hypothetical protein